MRVCSILGLSAIYEPNWVTLQVSLLPVLQQNVLVQSITHCWRSAAHGLLVRLVYCSSDKTTTDDPKILKQRERNLKNSGTQVLGLNPSHRTMHKVMIFTNTWRKQVY